jgi:hypothetical protein
MYSSFIFSKHLTEDRRVAEAFESVVPAYYIIEQFEKIVTIKNAVFTNENFMKTENYAAIRVFGYFY